MSTTTTKVTLTKPADWDLWISYVRARATYSQIWDLINPDLTKRPVALMKPILPRYVMLENNANF